jgi:hypothetical protein
VRQFQIDFSTTVEDLTAAIIHFLRDNAGVLNNTRTTAHARRTQTAEEDSVSLVLGAGAGRGVAGGLRALSAAG